MDPIGVHHLWGFTPALDLQEVYRAVAPTGEKGDTNAPLNILLAQTGDIRHVLKTIAQRRRHGQRPIHVRSPVCSFIILWLMRQRIEALLEFQQFLLWRYQ